MSFTGTSTVDLRHAELAIGWSGLRPFVVLHPDDRFHIDHCEVKLAILSHQADHLVVQVHISNRGTVPLRVRRIRWTAGLADGRKMPLLVPTELEPRYFSTELLRGEFLPSGTTLGDRYFQPLPNETVELGWSEDHAFPGLFITSATGRGCAGLFCAAASRDRLHLLIRLRGGDGKGRWNFELDELPIGMDHLVIPPGSAMTGEKLFFGLCDGDVQLSTQSYYEFLRSEGVFSRRAQNPLSEQRIYCSWNYDFMDDITEERFCSQIPVLREYFPQVRFHQLDHGYQRLYADGHRAQIDFLYETNEPFDRSRFPSGPKELVARIKSSGLRPAIWLGLWATSSSPMVARNPDWVLRDEMGVKLELGPYSVLDPSQSAVRGYLEYVCHTVFGEWGFEGVKLDFSTFGFEGRRVAYRDPTFTAAEHKRRLVQTFRRHLPADGFFGWCVVAGTGHPLLGPGADYFRCAEDIGRGDWATIIRIARWFANMNLLMPEWPVLPNIDSIGWSSHLSVEQQQTWLNLCAISGAALEVSGDLTKLDASRLRMLSRTLELSNASRRVQFSPAPGPQSAVIPNLWCSLRQDGVPELLALFNWSNELTTMTLDEYTCALLGGKPLADAWSGCRASAVDAVHLKPHESKLLVVGS